jgi:succinate-semialdehyde dehydrogenase/glutarate-semialdehyde dehydrogenase
MADPKLLYINGEWMAAQSGRTFAVTNPATGEPIAQVPDAGAADALEAVAAAHRAFPAWAGLTAYERGKALRRIYEAIMARVDELAAILTAEQGKPLGEAKAEIINGAEYLNWYAEEARRVYGETIPASSPNSRIWVIRQPVGPVAAITPWNFPSSMITRKIAPALAAGCTIVIKPAEQTPLSALALGQIFHEVGLPPGVVNIVTTNRPAEVGEVFLTDRRIAKISFTGSTAVGKYLAERAAKQMKRVSLELGGHAPIIVFPDADLEKAVKLAIGSKFRNAGQTCICANRIYVHKEILSAFTAQFTAAVAALKVGHGTEPGVFIGPMINEEGFRKAEEHVQDAVAKGAKVLVGGCRLTGPGYDGGWFWAPTVLSDVPADAKILQEETFGPVAPIIPFETEAEVIAAANDTAYGLAAYIFTKDLGRTIRVGEALQYGMIGVNEVLMASPQAPFGGIKESGYGREGGHHGLEGFLEYKYFNVALND